MRALLLSIVLLSGCVTRVQVCTSVDHAQHEYSRSATGASVCVDFEPAQAGAPE